MAIYNKSGTALSACYVYDGSASNNAYDYEGNRIFGEGQLDPQDWSGMLAGFKTNIDNAVEYIEDAIDLNSNLYAFPVFTDVHTYFGWHEPNYIAYHYPDLFNEFLILGDMTNSYDSTQLDNAVEYQNGASNQNLLVSIGNHEWGSYDTEGSNPYPREWYDDLLPNDSVSFNDDGLTYYWDDTTNNVRFIMMDSNSTVKKQSGTQRFNLDALEWMADVMEDADDMDIIILNHAMGGGFYLVTDTQEETWISDTSITNMTTFNNIVTAFQNGSTITVNNVEHDFSQNTGNFIAYITGHYHNAGHYDGVGFHKFTCPALIRNKQTGRGLSFFLIDPVQKTIQYIVSRIYSDQNEVYSYTY